MFQGPDNRLGFTQMSAGQLEIVQDVITPTVFVPFAVFSLYQSLKWGCLRAGLCLFGAFYFVFHGG